MHTGLSVERVTRGNFRKLQSRQQIIPLPGVPTQVNSLLVPVTVHGNLMLDRKDKHRVLFIRIYNRSPSDALEFILVM